MFISWKWRPRQECGIDIFSSQKTAVENDLETKTGPQITENNHLNGIAKLESIFRIFRILKCFFRSLYSVILEKNPFVFVAVRAFLGLYSLILEKNPFFVFRCFSFCAYTTLYWKKILFLIENGLKMVYTPLYSKKNHFFWNFRKPFFAYTRLILEKKPFFSAKKSFFFGPGN